VELLFDIANSVSLPEPLRARAIERLAGRLADGVLVVTAAEHRSQLRNREAARAKLSATLREAVAPPPRQRRPTKPSRSAVQRRLDEKRRRGEVKRGRSSQEW
jgi:ribosome-associated protein